MNIVEDIVKRYFNDDDFIVNVDNISQKQSHNKNFFVFIRSKSNRSNVLEIPFQIDITLKDFINEIEQNYVSYGGLLSGKTNFS